MNISPFKAIYPNLELIASPESFFGTVKAEYTDYFKNGFFYEDKESSLFVYHIQTPSRNHKGIIAGSHIEDFIQGKVLRHENTLRPKEQQMMNLMMQKRAMVKPILLAYDKIHEIDIIIDRVIKTQKPFLHIPFVESGEDHYVYKITNIDEEKTLIKLFKEKMSKCYIADGHHRVKTSILLHESKGIASLDLDYLLCVYFSWDQLSIYEYNRVIDAYQYTSPIRFMAELSKSFKITPLSKPAKPKSKNEMTMVLYGEWYHLTVRKKILQKYRDEIVLFDTFILNEYVLKKILNIQNIQEDTRVKYISGKENLEGLEDMVAKNDHRVGFCLYPVDYHEVATVANHGMTVPPKSTWFEPRIKNGILVKAF